MASSDYKIKHLEFIQLTITRMTANSFLLKAWAVTLVAGIFALAAKDSNQDYFVIAYIPVLAFWGLDSYYLKEERLFRKIYDSVRVKSERTIDFKLNPRDYSETGDWPRALISVSTAPFYLTLLLAVIVVIIMIGR